MPWFSERKPPSMTHSSGPMEAYMQLPESFISEEKAIMGECEKKEEWKATQIIADMALQKLELEFSLETLSNLADNLEEEEDELDKFEKIKENMMVSFTYIIKDVIKEKFPLEAGPMPIRPMPIPVIIMYHFAGAFSKKSFFPLNILQWKKRGKFKPLWEDFLTHVFADPWESLFRASSKGGCKNSRFCLLFTSSPPIPKYAVQAFNLGDICYTRYVLRSLQSIVASRRRLEEGRSEVDVMDTWTSMDFLLAIPNLSEFATCHAVYMDPLPKMADLLMHDKKGRFTMRSEVDNQHLKDLDEQSGCLAVLGLGTKMKSVPGARSTAMGGRRPRPQRKQRKQKPRRKMKPQILLKRPRKKASEYRAGARVKTASGTFRVKQTTRGNIFIPPPSIKSA